MLTGTGVAKCTAFQNERQQAMFQIAEACFMLLKSQPRRQGHTRDPDPKHLELKHKSQNHTQNSNT